MPIPTDENGTWRNKFGKYIHKGRIPEDVQLETELVFQQVDKIKEKQELLRELKAECYGDMYALEELLNDFYGVEKSKGNSGNVTFKSFDGSASVVISQQKKYSKNTKFAFAVEKLNSFVDRKTEELGEKYGEEDGNFLEILKARIDFSGASIHPADVLELRQIPIEDQEWKDGVELLLDSIDYDGTKSYIQIKEKTDGKLDGKLKHISLDFGAIDVSDEMIEKYRKIAIQRYREEQEAEL